MSRTRPDFTARTVATGYRDVRVPRGVDTAGLLIGTGFVAPWLFDETPLFVLPVIVAFLAFAHLFAAMFYAFFEAGQGQPRDSSR